MSNRKLGWAVGLTLGVAIFMFSGCKKGQPQSPVLPPASSASPSRSLHHGLPRVYALTYPLAYLADRVGGHVVEIASFSTDEDSAVRRIVESLTDEDLVLANSKDILSKLRKAGVNESAIAEVPPISGSSTAVADFDLARRQADAICDALQKKLPEQIELFALNYNLVQTELLGLDLRAQKASQRMKGRPVLAPSSAFMPWAERYHWDFHCILSDQERQQELVRQISKNTAPVVLISDQVQSGKAPDPKVEVLHLDSCLEAPSKGDWLSIMKRNVERLEALKAP